MRDETTQGDSVQRGSSTRQRIERAILAAIASDTSDDPELALAVRAFVAELRGQGTAPEHVLIAVKEIVRRARGRHAPETFDATTPSSRVAAKISSLCIDEYFRAD